MQTRQRNELHHGETKICMVKRLTDKSLLRLNQRLVLGFLYLGCFLLSGLLVYLERWAASSYMLMRYFKFIIDNRHAFVLGFSVIVLVFQYQLVVKARTEVTCRVLVGDTLMLIRLRYMIECLTLLGACFILSITVHLLLGFEIIDNIYLLAALAAYVLFSAGLIGVR